MFGPRWPNTIILFGQTQMNIINMFGWGLPNSLVMFGRILPNWVVMFSWILQNRVTKQYKSVRLDLAAHDKTVWPISSEHLHISPLYLDRTVCSIRHFLVKQMFFGRFDSVYFEWTLQMQSSTQCSNIRKELMIDYSVDFTTYEIFQSPEALITWAWEVDKLQGFIVVIKKFDINRHGRNENGRVLLSCNREGTYRNKNAKKIIATIHREVPVAKNVVGHSE